MSLNSTYGASLIGLIIASILYGVTLLQTLIYYRLYPKDSLFTKSLVFGIWFLDTGHLVLCTVAMYWYLVTNYGNPEALGKITWSQNIQTDFNGLIGLIVECFFAQRVYRFSGNVWLTVIIVILSLVHFGLGIVFTVEGFILVYSSKFHRLIWVTCIGLGSAAAADLLIAGALCYYLLQSRTGFARTDSLITTLSLYSLTTGLVTSIIALISVVLFATMPSNNIWLAFFWILGKCYVNSLLAALNSRESLRDGFRPSEATFVQLTPPAAVTLSKNTLGRRSLDVHIKTVSRTDCGYASSSSASGGNVDVDLEK